MEDAPLALADDNANYPHDWAGAITELYHSKNKSPMQQNMERTRGPYPRLRLRHFSNSIHYFTEEIRMKRTHFFGHSLRAHAGLDGTSEVPETVASIVIIDCRVCQVTP